MVFASMRLHALMRLLPLLTLSIVFTGAGNILLSFSGASWAFSPGLELFGSLQLLGLAMWCIAALCEHPKRAPAMKHTEAYPAHHYQCESTSRPGLIWYAMVATVMWALKAASAALKVVTARAASVLNDSHLTHKTIALATTTLSLCKHTTWAARMSLKPSLLSAARLCLTKLEIFLGEPSTQTTNAKLTQELATMGEKLHQAHTTNTHLSHKSLSQQDTISQLHKEVTTKKEELKKSSGVISQLQQQVATKDNERCKAITATAHLKQKCHSQQEPITQLQQQVTAQKEELSTANNANAQLLQQVSARHDALSTANSDLTQLQQQATSNAAAAVQLIFALLMICQQFAAQHAALMSAECKASQLPAAPTTATQEASVTDSTAEAAAAAAAATAAEQEALQETRVVDSTAEAAAAGQQAPTKEMVEEIRVEQQQQQSAADTQCSCSGQKTPGCDAEGGWQLVACGSCHQLRVENWRQKVELNNGYEICTRMEHRAEWQAQKIKELREAIYQKDDLTFELSGEVQQLTVDKQELSAEVEQLTDEKQQLSAELERLNEVAELAHNGDVAISQLMDQLTSSEARCKGLEERIEVLRETVTGMKPFRARCKELEERVAALQPYPEYCRQLRGRVAALQPYQALCRQLEQENESLEDRVEFYDILTLVNAL